MIAVIVWSIAAIAAYAALILFMGRFIRCGMEGEP